MSLAARFPLALKNSSCKSLEIGGCVSSVQHPEMAETTKHNIEVAILPGMNMGERSLQRRKWMIKRNSKPRCKYQPQTSSGYLKNDFDVSRNKGMDSNPNNCDSLLSTNTEGKTYKANSGRNGKGKSPAVDWDSLRKQAHANGEREQTMNTLDSDWEAVRLANVEDVAHTIKERRMNNVLFSEMCNKPKLFSARFALPAPKEGTKETSEDNAVNQKPVGNIKRL